MRIMLIITLSFLTSLSSANEDLDWKKPDGIVSLSVCNETSKIATDICSQKTEIFSKRNQPIETCDKHATPLSRFKNN